MQELKIATSGAVAAIMALTCVPCSDRTPRSLAIYHLSVKSVSRAGGRSATAAAAYRSASLIADARTGQIHDYQRRNGVADSFVVTPAGAEWAQDRSVLWNAAEAAERRKDAKVAREYQLALPHELNEAERRALARDFAVEVCARYGVVADVAIHAPDRAGDNRNWHAHILTTTRAVTPEGLGGKTRVLDVSATARVEVEALRSLWEERANEHLARAGHQVSIDRRSHLDRGLELAPTEHAGVHATQMQRRGKPGVDRVAIDQETAARNAELIAQRPEEVLRILTDEKAVFSRRDIARALHRYGIDEPKTFQSALAKVMSAEALVPLPAPGRKDPETFTTRAMLALETGMAESADRLLVDRSHKVGIDAVKAASSRRPELSEEQRAALRHVTGRERIASVIGLAGAGKSTMLGTAREAWEAAGYRVHGAALAGKAAEGLQASSGIASRTLASWQMSWTKDRDRLGKGDVLVVDEAGMVSSRQLAPFLDTVERAGAKVVLVGDPEQLQPIGPGAGFRALSERTGFLELEAIRRQHKGWQREASVALGTRDTRAGLAAYHESGAIGFSEDGAAAQTRLVTDYLHERSQRPEASRVALAHTRAEVRSLNEAIRAGLQRDGALQDEAAFSTEAGQRSFAAGDRIVFLRNDRELGVKNGSLATVTAAVAGRLTARLDGDGRNVTIAEGSYEAVDHGYATTIHKSQGATVDQAYVLASSGMDRHLTYVALTRHRDDVRVYAGRDAFADFEALASRLERGRPKASVLDHLGEAPERDESVRPAPLLKAQTWFDEPVEAVARAHADKHWRVYPWQAIRAVYRDAEAFVARLGSKLFEPDTDHQAVARRIANEPEAFGELLGKRRFLRGDDPQRERALRSVYGLADQISEVIHTWQRKYEEGARKEQERRAKAGLVIPAPSPAVDALLREFAALPKSDRETFVLRQLAEPAGRAVMDELKAFERNAASRLQAHSLELGLEKTIRAIPGLSDRDAERLIAVMKTADVLRTERISAEYQLERGRSLERGGPSLSLGR